MSLPFRAVSGALNARFHFGSSLIVVPLVQGGTLLVSIAFLLSQNAALALAALLMVPFQVALLPRFQRRLNAVVRERVLATRRLRAMMQVGHPAREEASSRLLDQLRLTRQLEDVRVRINDLKSFIKGSYNYTSNLTPFFFFSVGGFLVIRDQMSLGALVAALAAYREVTPALRELFDFAQGWSDARARFAEVQSVLQAGPASPPVDATAATGFLAGMSRQYARVIVERRSLPRFGSAG